MKSIFFCGVLCITILSLSCLDASDGEVSTSQEKQQRPFFKIIEDYKGQQAGIREYASIENLVTQLAELIQDPAGGYTWWDKDREWIYIYPTSLGAKRVHMASLYDKTMNYKIHLMPKQQDIIPIINRLVAMFKANAKFRNAVAAVKFDIGSGVRIIDRQTPAINKIPVMHRYDPVRDRGLIESDKDNIVPKIVIYAVTGKDKAQYVLDEVYKEFLQLEGLDMPPRFNEKVTSLIYFAQGDGDEKLLPKKQYLFEFPDRVYYRDDVLRYYYELKDKNAEQLEEEKALVNPKNKFQLRNPADPFKGQLSIIEEYKRN